MEDLSGAIGYEEVLLAVLLVGVVTAIYRLRGVGLEWDMAVATVRIFLLQLA